MLTIVKRGLCCRLCHALLSCGDQKISHYCIPVPQCQRCALLTWNATLEWWNVFCFRMAGVFDIDLENEDISDTEVCIQRSLMRWLKEHWFHIVHLTLLNCQLYVCRCICASFLSEGLFFQSTQHFERIKLICKQKLNCAPLYEFACCVYPSVGSQTIHGAQDKNKKNIRYTPWSILKPLSLL